MVVAVLVAVGVLALQLRHTITDAAIGSTIGWQEHSKNDLRGWNQMLQKGGRNFKIDPQYLHPLECKFQINVRNKSDPRGCFIFNHDTVVDGHSRNSYNTTDDLLGFVSNPSHSTYFGAVAKASHPEPFVIALCFKQSPPICSSSNPTTAKWLSLVDDFFATANAMIAQHNLHLQFVLDGDASGSPICTCLMNRWRPWVATYIPGGGQSPGACTTGAFHSNNPKLGYDRFQILNEPSAHFNDAVLADYGKFVNSTLNYQIYEPKDQSEIVQRSNEYINRSLVHTAGVNFAINIDSAMLQVYVGASNTTNTTGWNEVHADTGSSPQLLVFTGIKQRLLVIYFKNQTGLMYTIDTFTGGAGAVLHTAVRTNLPADYLGQDSAVTSMSTTEFQGNTMVLVCVGTGMCESFHFDPSSSKLVSGLIVKVDKVVAVAFNISLESDVSAICELVACPAETGFTQSTICVAQLAVTVDSKLTLRWWWMNVSVVGLVSAPGLISSVAVSAVSPTDGSHVRVTAVNVQVGRNDVPTIIMAWSGNGHVFAATATGVGKTWSILTSPKPVAVGRSPHLSYVPSPTSIDPRQGIVNLVYMDGFCQNNEAQNKDAKVSVCDVIPTATEGVLGYGYGLLSSFQDVLRSQSMLNACSDTIMHGAYDRGSSPSAGIFVNPTASGQLSIVGVHEGPGGFTQDPGLCGLALNRSTEALVLSGWTAANLHAITHE
eukprot:m.156355 g.156355  ORF g.156355 m.156355 type:complete len:715 (+) comp30989_c0_seq1:239-2383(+)